MDCVLQRLQSRSHDNAGDFQKELLNQFDRELQAFSNRLAAQQRAAADRLAPGEKVGW
jgi:hypothetical protein